MIITISGLPGSGKSVVARALADRLGFAHVSAGDFMREMAAEREMTILELSRRAERDDAIDREIDARTVRFSEQQDDFVMDARLAWHFIPSSIKVFLDVSRAVAASRIFGDDRATEGENVDTAATLRAIDERVASERLRYQKYYGVDYLEPSQFDLVVDTSERSVAQVVDEIVRHLRTDGKDRRHPSRAPGPL